MKPQSKYTPTIIPPTHTSTTPAESFATPSRGVCTWHTLISSPSTSSSSLSAGIAVCPPLTGSLCAHRHSHAEIYYVLAGKGVMTIDGTEHVVEAGSTVFLPGDVEHGVVNQGEDELRWFYVFAADSFGDVVYRFTEEERTKKTEPEKARSEVKKGKKDGDRISLWSRLKTLLA